MKTKKKSSSLIPQEYTKVKNHQTVWILRPGDMCKGALAECKLTQCRQFVNTDSMYKNICTMGQIYSSFCIMFISSI